MTVKLYDNDSHLYEFTAQVLDSYKAADGYFTILDRTAFFPEAGGQPADTGFLNGVKVYDVQIEDEIIYHYTAEPFEKGEIVKGVLDWERRFDFMQQHSAEHIISGIANKLYGCENVGFHLGEDIVTLDFDKMLDAEQISKLEELANKTVFLNKQIKAYYPQREELENIPYRSKKELQGDIRIVEIEDTDFCACCAPHVNFTGEIGLIKLLGTEKLRGGIRIELKAGNRALSDYQSKSFNTLKISNMLCVKQYETAVAVEKLIDQISELKYKLNGFKKQILEEKINSLNLEDNVTAVFEQELEMKDIQFFANALFEKSGGIRGVFCLNDNSYSFAICGDEEGLREFFAKFKSQFTVKGGGRGTMVQGTVVATEEQISSFFN